MDYPEKISRVEMMTPVGVTWREACSAIDAKINRIQRKGGQPYARIPGHGYRSIRMSWLMHRVHASMNSNTDVISTTTVHADTTSQSEACVIFKGTGNVLIGPQHACYVFGSWHLGLDPRGQIPRRVLSSWVPSAPKDHLWALKFLAFEQRFGTAMKLCFPTHGMGDPGHATQAVLIAYALYLLRRALPCSCVAIMPTEEGLS